MWVLSGVCDALVDTTWWVYIYIYWCISMGARGLEATLAWWCLENTCPVQQCGALHQLFYYYYVFRTVPFRIVPLTEFRTVNRLSPVPCCSVTYRTVNRIPRRAVHVLSRTLNRIAYRSPN